MIVRVDQKEELLKYSAVLDELDRRKREERIKFFYPDYDTAGFFARHKYAKHLDFFEAGKDFFARLAMCANGVGKTEGMGLYEVVCHLTNDYPVWWEGHRFSEPLDVWLVGSSGEKVRDALQTKFIGKPYLEHLGGGMMPISKIDFDSIRRFSKPAGLIDTMRVKRNGGGYSYIAFKSYRQGLDAFYGEEKHLVYLDEPPPADIFGQCAARTRNRKGARLIVTATPLDGRTETIKLFMDEPSQDRKIIYCGWDEVPHLTDDEKRKMLESQPIYMRETVSTGMPLRGHGAVYPMTETSVIIDPFKIPAHWKKCFGFDGGFHNTAAVWMAHDTDADIVYIYDEYKNGGVDAAVHADAIKKRGDWIPGAGDAAAINQSDGKKILDIYKRAGVNLRLADKSVSSGLAEVFNRFSTGRLKIFSTCQKTRDEFSTYSYDEENKIIKANDHLMDALRYAIVSGLKIATTKIRDDFINYRTEPNF